jgi:conjugative transposon TraM protein
MIHQPLTFIKSQIQRTMKKINFKDRKFRIALMSAPMFLLPLALLAFTLISGMESSETYSENQLNASIPQVQVPPVADQAGKLKAYENKHILKDRAVQEDYFSGTDTVVKKPIAPQIRSDKVPGPSQEHLIDQQLKQLEALEKSLMHPEPVTSNISGSEKERPKISGRQKDPEMARLEALMERMEQKKSEPDPEMMQLENILDKIMMLQFPQTQETSVVNGQLFEVKAAGAQDWDARSMEPEGNGFFGLSENIIPETELTPAISAMVDENKKIISGNSIRMRLLEEVSINGIPIPAQTKIYGTCRLEGERLLIQIEHIRSGNHLLPVQLEAFGMDAIKGLHIPGALGRDAAKEGMDRSVQGVNPMMGGISLETQLAAGGIETARGFLSKKTRLKKVNVKQGHPLLLVDRS